MCKEKLNSLYGDSGLNPPLYLFGNHIILVGGRLFNFWKEKDLDVIIISNNQEMTKNFRDILRKYRLKFSQIKLDVRWLGTIDEWKIKLANINKDRSFFALYFYQYDFHLHDKNCLININILDYIPIIKITICRVLSKINLERLLKMKFFYHVLFNMFIVENNSIFLTKEQKEIIVAAHDLTLDAKTALTCISNYKKRIA